MTSYKDWKTAVSLGHLTFANPDKPDYYERLKVYKQAGVDAIEVSIGGLRFWEGVDWDKLNQYVKDADIEVWSVHLPFHGLDPASTDEELRKKTIATHCELIDIAAKLGAKVVVVHPGLERRDKDTVNPDLKERQERIEQSKKSAKELCDYAESYGIAVAYEDLPRTCIGHDTKEMKELCDSDERLKICFDVNHLLYSTHEEFVHTLGDRIVTLHISDYDFVDERHLFPGVGKINWKELVELLEEADYNGPWLYECSYGKNTNFEAEDAPLRTPEDYRKAQMNIKNL